MNLSLFRRRASAGQTSPHHQAVTVPVNVTMVPREAKPDGVDWKAPDAETVAHIGAHLPNAGSNEPTSGSPSASLIAARHAAVLDQEAAFLTDRKGNVPPPEEADLIAALRFAAEHIRDGIVIA